MSYIAAEDVAKAKEMDLLTYLRNYEPQELVHVSGNTYCTREHDSLRISNGKWCWFSQGIGGRSALDYLIKVKGIPFTQAVEIILGREAEKPPVFYRQKERMHTDLLMPELSETTDCVEKYLQGRGIHPVIIRYCLDMRRCAWRERSSFWPASSSPCLRPARLLLIRMQLRLLWCGATSAS